MLADTTCKMQSIMWYQVLPK